jgi:3',5'-cyclic AMP phosphodiesterase CpdA
MPERSFESPVPPTEAADARPFALAHLSDRHATPVRVRSPLELANKRALGWLSWWRKRRKEHLPHVLEALIEDLRTAGADHVGVTGDLTHLGLDSEIAEATAWLERIGPPSRVSVVPGNHDAYAGDAGIERWSPWAPYMSSVGFAMSSAGIAMSSEGNEAAGALGFPFVRPLGRVALVGVSSARPTAPLLATGRLGEAQRERLEALLAQLGEAGLCRVVLMHHPPVPAGQSRRRQLEDAAELRALLARTGAELVLHGHTHRSHFATLPGPRHPIPVIGVPSSSAIGGRPGRRARYHIYRIVPRGGASGSAGFALSFCARAFDPLRGGFVAAEERSL